MKSHDITGDVISFFEKVKDIEQCDRIRTARETDNNGAAIKESFTPGIIKDLFKDKSGLGIVVIFFQNQNPLGKFSFAPAKKSSSPPAGSGGSGGTYPSSGPSGSGIGASSVVTLSKL